MTYALEKSELVKLVNGKFKSFKCTACDGKGWYWVREDDNMIDPLAQSGEGGDLDYKLACTECDGLGFKLKFDD